VRLPEGESFFNRPAQRGDLHVVHLRTASSTERAALLAHSDEIIAGASSSSSSSSAAVAYSVLLENKFRSGEFALIAESSAASGEPPEGSSLASRLGEWVSAAPCSETGDVLSFGPPLWPEDMAMQHADIGEEASDAATFSDLSG
jgi:hypothetical protein